MLQRLWPFASKEQPIALLAIVAIAVHLWLRFGSDSADGVTNLPLHLALIFGGLPLVYDLVRKMFRREFGSDLLAGISIVTSLWLGEYLAGALVVLMLSGGASLEHLAVGQASSVLRALAKRMPNIAHRRVANQMSDVPLEEIHIGDTLIVLPHETCPVDGFVLEGHSVMDESYLTGEPFMISKTPGSKVISGAVNGTAALTIQASKLPLDSRYAKIVEVMKEAERNRPQLRRLGDTLGAWYTPIAVAIAFIAWGLSGDPIRFLAVLVVATPCPLLIAIPVAIVGSISLAAKRGILIRNPAILEQLGTCKTIIFDKTGTLTYGVPNLSEQLIASDQQQTRVLQLAASLEQYSKHPLGRAIWQRAHQEQLSLLSAAQVSEPPGQGMNGEIDGHQVSITSRKLAQEQGIDVQQFPEQTSGLECLILVDGRYAATYRFHDTVRSDGFSFIQHLGNKHQFQKVMLVSGDRESEVRYLAECVGIKDVHFSKSPEEKVEIVSAETAKARTVFIGDGINDAPALLAANVGIAFGQFHDVTSEAAGAVLMDTALVKVDELFHIGERMRVIALQSAVGGMVLSIAGMFFAALGHLPPVSGAITQEFIDVFVILNALRAAFPPKQLIDYDAGNANV